MQENGSLLGRLWLAMDFLLVMGKTEDFQEKFRS